MASFRLLIYSLTHRVGIITADLEEGSDKMPTVGGGELLHLFHNKKRQSTCRAHKHVSVPQTTTIQNPGIDLGRLLVDPSRADLVLPGRQKSFYGG